jgi:hypothetical protein
VIHPCPSNGSPVIIAGMENLAKEQRVVTGYMEFVKGTASVSIASDMGPRIRTRFTGLEITSLIRGKPHGNMDGE